MVVTLAFSLINDIIIFGHIRIPGHHTGGYVRHENQPICPEGERIVAINVGIPFGSLHVVETALLEQPSVGIEHVVQRMDACGDVLFQILRCIGRTGSELLDPDRDRNAPAFGRTGVEILLDTRYGAQQTEERKR